MLLPTDIHQRKKRGEAMTENKIIIPIWKKSNLTVEEAAAYCGIGSRKLRETCPPRPASLGGQNAGFALLFFGMEVSD